MKTYSIVYQAKGKQPETVECTEYSLQKYLEHLVQENVEVLSIATHRMKRKEKPKDINKIEKSRYYTNQYSIYCRYHKNGRIDATTYEEIKAKLKELKSICKTRQEYQQKFEEYKKSANIILQYNASK